MQDMVREATCHGHDVAGPVALAAQVRLFRSAALAGASQTAARPGPRMKKHNALARRLLDRQDDPPGSGSYRVKHPSASLCQVQDEDMATRLDQRGWTAAQHVAPCVICHQPAILRSSLTCSTNRARGQVSQGNPSEVVPGSVEFRWRPR